jgi:hypothetical protein
METCALGTCAIGMKLYNGILWFTRGIYHPKGCSTTVERTLQIPLKMQNKANLSQFMA